MQNNISRRSFIKLTAACGAAIGLAGALGACGGGSNSVTCTYKFIPEVELTYDSSLTSVWYKDAFSAYANGQKLDIQNGGSWITAGDFIGTNGTQTHKPEFKSTNNAVSSAFKDGGQIEFTVKLNGAEQKFILTKSGANYSANPASAKLGNFTVKIKNATYEVSEKTS